MIKTSGFIEKYLQDTVLPGDIRKIIRYYSDYQEEIMTSLANRYKQKTTNDKFYRNRNKLPVDHCFPLTLYEPDECGWYCLIPYVDNRIKLFMKIFTPKFAIDDDDPDGPDGTIIYVKSCNRFEFV